MSFSNKPRWIEWAKKIQSIAQTGLHYSNSEFDRQRYEQLNQIAAEIFAEQTEYSFKKIKNIFDNQTGHATPRIDVRGAAFKDNKVLLVRETSDEKWTLPGGWADPFETLSESIEREFFEETGYKVKLKKIVAIYDRDKRGHFPPHPYHVYKIFGICEIIDGKPAISFETDAIEFFDINKLPALSSGRINEFEIIKCYEHYLNPEKPTEFD
jgi:ADP-ribose pyrophosphatase YjhB (NUDIX family)